MMMEACDVYKLYYFATISIALTTRYNDMIALSFRPKLDEMSFSSLTLPITNKLSAYLPRNSRDTSLFLLRRTVAPESIA